MLENIDLFYSLRSSYSYLALDRILDLQRKYNINIRVKLVLPLAVRKKNYFEQLPKNRKSYGVMDNIRIAEYYNIPFQWPEPDPVKFTNGIPDSHQPLAYKISRLGVLANIKEKGLEYVISLSRLIWDGKTTDWNQTNLLKKTLNNIGLDYEKMIEDINKSPDIYDQILEENAQELERSGHWGVPTLVLNKEPFFGQDRLEIFEWKLKKFLNN